MMCAPPDTDPAVGGGPALRDTVNSLVLETPLVIRTLVENKQEQESRVRTEAEFKLFWKAADQPKINLLNCRN